MNRERLENFATFLDGLSLTDGERFDMEQWSCGTAACAIGWGAIRGALPGLEMMPDDEFGLYPAYDGSVGMGAVARYFDICQTDADSAFSPHYDAEDETPATIAARIREILAP